MRSLSSQRLSLCLLFVLVLLVAGFSPASAQQINPQLAPGESFADYKISPDGAFAVYRVSRYAYIETPYYSYPGTVYDLYSLNIANGASRKLNPAALSGTEVSSYEISPDSRSVVYIANQDNIFFRELYSVSITGGHSSRMSGNCPSNANGCSVQGGFKITPDSRFAVFTAEVVTSDYNYNYNFNSAPLSGGNARTLTQGLPAGNAGDYQISPEGSHIAYVYNSFNGVDYESKLYTLHVTGGSPKYMGNATDMRDFHFAFTPDSRTLIFRSDRDGYGEAFQPQLFSAAVNGNGTSQQISLNGETVEDMRVFKGYNAVLYTVKAADGTVTFAVTGADGFQRYAIPTNLKVNDNSLVLANDRSIVFTASRPFGTGFGYYHDLFSLSLNGSQSAPARLSFENYPQYSQGIRNFKVSPNGERVVFTAPARFAYAYELFSVPVAGGNISQLNTPFQAARQFDRFDIRNYEITADSQRVVFATPEYDAFYNDSLFTNNIAGGAVNRAAYGNGFSFTVAPNSRSLFYTAYSNDQSGYRTTNLYKAVFP